jgi:glycosyltransferase involved in cell wall biosynthesis
MLPVIPRIQAFALGMASPLVSVVIPTFNRPDLLRQSLASAIAQSYGNIEIIVQDNASAEDPQPVVASFNDPRVRYIRRASTVSQTENIVSACRHATGTYVALLCDDDLWLPGFLAVMVPPLERDPGIALSFCDHDIIGPDGRRDDTMTEKITRTFHRHRIRSGVHRPFEEIALVYRSIPTLSGAVLRRTALDWPSLPQDMPFGLDIYLAYRLARTGLGCYYVPERLAQIRYHPVSVSSAARHGERRIMMARNALAQWQCFAGDEALTRGQSYFQLKAGLNALAIVVGLLRSHQSQAALREFLHFWREGIVRPRLMLYHLFYATRLRRLRA